MAITCGYIAVYEPTQAYKAFRYSNGNAGFERVVSVTQMVGFARKCVPVALTPQQIRSVIHSSGQQFKLVQIGSAFFKRIANEWVVLS